MITVSKIFKYILTLSLFFAASVGFTKNLGDSFPITVSSNNELLKKIIRDYKSYLSKIKVHADVRMNKNSLILELESDVLPTTELGQCSFKRAQLQAKSTQKENLSYDELVVVICGEKIGSISLTRQGSNIKPLTEEQILTGDLPLPESSQLWILKSSWSSQSITILTYENKIVGKYINDNMKLILTEHVLENEVRREHFMIFNTSNDRDQAKISAKIRMLPGDFAPSLSYFYELQPIDPRSYAQMYPMITYFLPTAQNAFYNIPNVTLP